MDTLAVLVAGIPETTHPAKTVQAEWPAIEALPRLRVQRPTAGANRVIKQRFMRALALRGLGSEPASVVRLSPLYPRQLVAIDEFQLFL